MKEYCLGDLIDIKHGFAFDGEHIISDDNGIVLVTPGNFKIGGGFQEEKCKFFSGDIPKEYILHGGDYIVTMTDLSKSIDTLGYSAIVPVSNRIYLHNQRIGLISFKNDACDKDYIYYLMQTYSYQRAIANTSAGATVHHTSPSKIREFRFFAPEKDQQIRISKFLRAIDDLIENNQKQIKLLEEAAQRLYKEWFVDLRFPGYETTLIVDGVPEGWEKKGLGKLIEFNPKYHVSKEVEKRVFPMSALSTTSMVLDWSESEMSLSTAGAKFSNGDTLLARITPCLENGKTAYVDGLSDGEVAVGSTEFIVMRSKMITPHMVYLLARNNDFRETAINSMTGSDGRQRAQVDKLKQYPSLLPARNIIDQFSTITEPLFSGIHTLNKKNSKLAEARDRLLPKLIIGEIEV